MKAKIILTGHKAIDRKLRQLEPKLAKKVIRQEIRKALKPMLATAKALAPEGESGQLKKAIKIKSGLRSRGRIKLVVMIGEGDFKGDSFYGAFAELGTGAHRKKPSGKPRVSKQYAGWGGQMGKRFMLRAFRKHRHSARDAAEKGILAGAIRLIKEKG